QQRTIKGKVLDNTGRPLPGVTVRVKNTTQETQTDQQGQFELRLTDGTVVLTFSSLGFETQEMSVAANEGDVNVQLNDASSSLEEVVVVGYGTQKKVNLTDAVATVSGKDMIKRPVVNTASMLQGAVPGVQINQGSGEPGNEGVS